MATGNLLHIVSDAYRTIWLISERCLLQGKLKHLVPTSAWTGLSLTTVGIWMGTWLCGSMNLYTSIYTCLQKPQLRVLIWGTIPFQMVIYPLSEEPCMEDYSLSQRLCQDYETINIWMCTQNETSGLTSEWHAADVGCTSPRRVNAGSCSLLDWTFQKTLRGTHVSKYLKQSSSAFP